MSRTLTAKVHMCLPVTGGVLRLNIGILSAIKKDMILKTAYVLVALTSLVACTAGDRSDANADLKASCEALVAAETGRRPGDVTALATQPDPTGSVTAVSVIGADAPWLCRADPAGVVTGVEFSRSG